MRPRYQCVSSSPSALFVAATFQSMNVTGGPLVGVIVRRLPSRFTVAPAACSILRSCSSEHLREGLGQPNSSPEKRKPGCASPCSAAEKISAACSLARSTTATGLLAAIFCERSARSSTPALLNRKPLSSPELFAALIVTATSAADTVNAILLAACIACSLVGWASAHRWWHWTTALPFAQ